MSHDRLHILRRRGGQVEVEGAIDTFAADVLKRAGFMSFSTLYGKWVRLPFDMGEAWENEHASWAADMLAAARYSVRLAPDLRHDAPTPCAPSVPARPPAMSAQAPLGSQPHR